MGQSGQTALHGLPLPGSPRYAGAKPWAPQEEQFVLRCPPSVAQRIRCLLREEDSAAAVDKNIRLFLKGPRTGVFQLGNDKFPVSVLDLPTQVETWKSYDDINLVKCNDIGQIIVVREPKSAAPGDEEAADGVLPPFRQARKQFFRKPHTVNPEFLESVQAEIVRHISGAPQRVAQEDEIDFIESEEEYSSDDDDGLDPSMQVRAASGRTTSMKTGGGGGSSLRS